MDGCLDWRGGRLYCMERLSIRDILCHILRHKPFVLQCMVEPTYTEKMKGK